MHVDPGIDPSHYEIMTYASDFFNNKNNLTLLINFYSIYVNTSTEY
jgi:hypothetical protein